MAQYLGVIAQDGKCEADVRARLGMTKCVLTELEHIWKSKAITTSTKLRLLTSLVWPVGSCGTGAWSSGMVLWEMGTTEVINKKV